MFKKNNTFKLNILEVRKFNFVFFLLFNISFCLFGQGNSNEIRIYNWFDELVGHESLGLLNGKIYYDIYFGKTVDDTHVFFEKNEPTKGSIVYNGNLYYDLDLMYDVYNDELIYNSKSNIGTMQLIKELISQFSIKGLEFYNLENVSIEGGKMNGFFELVYANKGISLYKKHFKKKKDVIVDDKLRHKFYQKFTYVIHNKEYKIIKTKSDIKNYFPEHKAFVKEFYKNDTNRLLKTKNYNAFTEKLIISLIKKQSSI